MHQTDAPSAVDSYFCSDTTQLVRSRARSRAGGCLSWTAFGLYPCVARLATLLLGTLWRPSSGGLPPRSTARMQPWTRTSRATPMTRLVDAVMIRVPARGATPHLGGSFRHPQMLQPRR